MNMGDVMKVIFLDFDGVLNSDEYFERTKDDKINRSEFDDNSLKILREIINLTDAKIVVTSTWKELRRFDKVKEYLESHGILVYDTTRKIDFKRGEEIRDYLSSHKDISEFVIVDDEVFPDFNELTKYLVKTDFYSGGLKEEHKCEIVKRLRKCL